MNRLSEIEARTNAATEGPWMPNTRGVGCQQGHLLSALESPNWSADVTFTAHARTDVPDMAAALRAVLEMHERRTDRFGEYCGRCFQDEGDWPCPTVAAIHQHLGDDQ